MIAAILRFLRLRPILRDENKLLRLEVIRINARLLQMDRDIRGLRARVRHAARMARVAKGVQ